MIGTVREIPPGEMDAACERGTGRSLPRLHAQPAARRRNALQSGRRPTLEAGVTSISSREPVGNGKGIVPAPRIPGRRHVGSRHV